MGVLPILERTLGMIPIFSFGLSRVCGPWVMLFRSALVSLAFQVQRLTRSGLTKPPCCCMGHPVMLSFLPPWTLLDLLRPKVMGPTGGRADSVPDAAGAMATAACVISETLVEVNQAIL